MSNLTKIREHTLINEFMDSLKSLKTIMTEMLKKNKC